MPPAGAATRAPKFEDVPEHDTKLEPDTPLPAKEPYEMGALGWAGTVGAGVFGGLVGLTAGGLFGLAVDSTMGGHWGAITLGASMLIGAGGAAWLAHEGFSNAGAARHEATFQASTGSSTLHHARDMISEYDHDQSGSIELDTANLGSLDERARTESRSRHDEDRIGPDRYTETRTISALRVWERADNAPKDGTITDVELATLMANHDAGADGILKSPEQEAFAAAHPVAVGDWED